jgi:hypothetical protein
VATANSKTGFKAPIQDVAMLEKVAPKINHLFLSLEGRKHNLIVPMGPDFAILQSEG